MVPEQPETVDLYGHKVKLPQPGNGAIITDVVLIVRQVMTNEDGDLDDDIGLSLTSQTTGCILTGMLSAAPTQKPTTNSRPHSLTAREAVFLCPGGTMNTTPPLTTVRGRIERAERALRTGQPELAMTYMRAARDQIRDEKVARFAEAFAIKFLGSAIKAINEAAAAFAQGLGLALRNVGQVERGELQSDYVLAAGRSA